MPARTALVAVLAMAGAATAAMPADIKNNVHDAVQAKLDAPISKVAAIKDKLEAPMKAKVDAVASLLPNPHTAVVKSGGLGMCTAMATKKLITMGDVVDGEYFGVLRTIDGTGKGFVYSIVNETNPLALPSNGAQVTPECAGRGLRAAIAYATNVDIPTIHVRDGKYYMISHRENAPGGMDFLTIEANKDGDLVPASPTDVDFTADGGVWYPCAGSVTPTDTHLGSEEFEPDCRYGADSAYAERSNDGLGAPITTGVLGQVAQWSIYQNVWPRTDLSPGTCLASPPKVGLANTTKSGSELTPPTVVYTPPLDQFTCYKYGWTPEASPNPPAVQALGGPAAQTRKLFTLGRFSHEVSVIMGDSVVIMGDDRTNGMLSMFVMDKKGDLTSGTLYAAKLSDQKDGNATTGLGAEWSLSWVRLGHGTQGKLASLVDTIQFTDMFETAAVVGNGTNATCPDGFTLIVTVMAGTSPYIAGNGRYIECLKIKEGMAEIAAFFESRRVAGIYGATTEFEKLEGVTYNPKTKKAYMASARTAAGATPGNLQSPKYSNDLVTADDMRLPPNRCGVVFEADLGADWIPTRLRVMLAGTQQGTTASSSGPCDISSIAGPDNVHVIPGTSTLVIAEDVNPARGHPNCFLWAYDTLRPEKGLVRIGVAPWRSEFTGIYTNFVGKDAYLTYAVQHPGPDLPENVLLGMPGPGNIGYIGPIPAASLTGVHAPALQAAAIDIASKGKFRKSPEAIVWEQAKELVEVTFEPVPYTLPNGVGYNNITQQTTARVCGGPSLL